MLNNPSRVSHILWISNLQILYIYIYIVCYKLKNIYITLQQERFNYLYNDDSFINWNTNPILAFSNIKMPEIKASRQIIVNLDKIIPYVFNKEALICILQLIIYI